MAEGLWRMRDIAPDSFFSSEFASSREVHPCISEEEGTLVEEIGFVIALGDRVSAVYSLMRSNEGCLFSATEFQTLAEVGPIICAAMRRHYGLRNGPEKAPAATPITESAFRLAFGGQLTPTQQTVVRLILRGHSNVSIASQLGIAEGTAKMHRYSIYRRLGITSQSELFQAFIQNFS